MSIMVEKGDLVGCEQENEYITGVVNLFPLKDNSTRLGAEWTP